MADARPIMIVEDDVALSRLILDILSDDGQHVRVFHDPYRAVAEFGNERFSLVITDIKMPGMDGIELLDQVKRINPHVPVIIITAHATVDVSIQALRKGADDLITKPFESEEFLYRVRKTLRNNALLEENLKLKQELFSRFRFENIIGISDGIKQVLQKVEKVAQRDLPVLIIGESGTGKELVSQAIHYNSPRKDHPFIAINCGALPQSLLEGELFGYRKGAFTGATADRAGLIELAHEGTLFLDEVVNLTPEVQKVLLRFLQEKEFRRLGDGKTIRVDVRVISATNTDLRKAITLGSFREDLYYRLNGITISIPPLRERTVDIPILIASFISNHNKKFGTDFAGFTPEAMECLLRYQWPGNVRELGNVVEAALALAGERHIGRDAVIQFIGEPEAREDEGPEGDFQQALSRFEREYFTSLLRKCRGNVEEAARQAGINVVTLYRKIKKYQLKKDA
ncbi:MAG: sigma-54 dependent transcriptional regulator [Thermodesulfovibrionales bacterium]